MSHDEQEKRRKRESESAKRPARLRAAVSHDEQEKRRKRESESAKRSARLRAADGRALAHAAVHSLSPIYLLSHNMYATY
jgi:hypothetical protein